jgi:hypothetical protein
MEKIHNPPIVTEDAVLYQGQRIADIERLPDVYIQKDTAVAVLWLANAGSTSWSHTEQMSYQDAKILRDKIVIKISQDAGKVAQGFKDFLTALRVLTLAIADNTYAWRVRAEVPDLSKYLQKPILEELYTRLNKQRPTKE